MMQRFVSVASLVAAPSRERLFMRANNKRAEVIRNNKEQVDAMH
jgi:hypothetical protein